MAASFFAGFLQEHCKSALWKKGFHWSHFANILSSNSYSHIIVLVDLNEFPSIFQKVQLSYSRHQKTTSNLLRINLKGHIKVQWNMATRGSYVHNSMVESWKCYVLCIFSETDGFRQKDSQAFRTHTTL